MNYEKPKYYDTYEAGLRLGLDHGLRAQRSSAANHLSLHERIARRVRCLIHKSELEAVYFDGIGYRITEVSIQRYEKQARRKARRRIKEKK